MQRTDSLEKTLMLGKIEGRRRRGQQRMRCWMASPTLRMWVWASSGNRWWTGRPGVLQCLGSQRVGHDWATELKYTVTASLRNKYTVPCATTQNASVSLPVKWDCPQKTQLKLLMFLQAAMELSQPSDENSMFHQSWVSGAFTFQRPLIQVWSPLNCFLICCPYKQESVQFSNSVLSKSLWHHGLQHTRLPCPSPTPGAYSNSCPLKGWVKGVDASSSRLVIALCLQASLFMSANIS